MVKIPPTVSDMDIVLDKEKRKLVQKTKKQEIGIRKQKAKV